MMKKLLALVLCLALLLLSAAALAEETTPATKKNLGTVSINGEFTLNALLPEGYSVIYQTSSADDLVAVMAKEDLTEPIMTLHIAFDETYADVARMNDLTAEDLEILERSFTDTDPTTEITYAETTYGTQVLVAMQLDREADYLELLSVYKGYFIEFAITAGPSATDRNLTEEKIIPCVQFLSDLDFVPAGQETLTVELANRTYIAVMGEVDEETGTVTMTLKEPKLFTKNDVETLAEGSLLNLGGEFVTVDTVETDEDGDLIVNGEIYIIWSDAQDAYTVSLYGEMPYLITQGTADVTIPADAVFADGVAQETFEALEEPVMRTGADFLTMLQAHDEADVGFTSDNVSVSFDEDGSLMLIERFYTPWQ